MHSASQSQVLWVSILVSAIVAGFVTILIEYLAKPRLEARKERILDAHRREREAIEGLRRAVQRGNLLYSFAKGKYADDEPTQGRMKKWISEIDQSIDMALTTLNVPHPLNDKWQLTLGYITGSLAKDTPPGEKDMERMIPVFDELDLYVTLLSTPWWHHRRRRRIINILLRGAADGEARQKPGLEESVQKLPNGPDSGESQVPS
jgi:hypothetical protein